MERLYEIDEAVRTRVEEIAGSHGEWPCRKGCDECCRRLASSPRVSRPEWERIAAAVAALPPRVAQSVRERIRESAEAPRPVVCPLLDTAAGTCLVYEARPVACRAYGFYADRELVLGCGRIESIARDHSGVV